MTIIRNGQADEAQEHFVADDEAIPDEGAVVVSAARWLERRESLTRRGRVGLRLSPDFELESLEGHLQGLELIEVDFPRYVDGRGYSQARLLRERFGYSRELRAVGDVLPDQLHYMARCGFDAFAIKPGKRVDTALAAMAHLTCAYQPAADRSTAHWRH